jgi:hypothetical protein
MSNLPIEGEMVRAFQSGVKQYQPVCAGLDLEPECGDPATTTRNLHRVVSSSPERSILAVISSGASSVLIALKTGESYLATGYSIGSEGPGTAELARFLVEHNDGDWREDYDEMFEVLATWPSDMAGPIPLPTE